MKKRILIPLCLVLLAAVLTGCAAGNANTLGATQAPVVTSTPEPAATPMNTIAPAVTAAPAGTADTPAGTADAPAGAMTPADAGRLAERISEAVERISEIDDAQVVVSDDRALVAVEFEEQYSAGLDERMKKLITDTVKKEGKTITEVSITDDGTLYGQVKSLAERVGKATGLEELADDMGDLWDRVTGM